MRLGVKDHKVIAAFVDRKAFDGDKLSTDGQRLDGHWLGGARIAEWVDGQIRLNDKGSRAAESVHRQVRGHAAPVQIEGWKPSRRVSRRDSSARRDASKPYSFRHQHGGAMSSIRGPWVVEGPGVRLTKADRTDAALLTRNLNIAFAEGRRSR